MLLCHKLHILAQLSCLNHLFWMNCWLGKNNLQVFGSKYYINYIRTFGLLQSNRKRDLRRINKSYNELVSLKSRKWFKLPVLQKLHQQMVKLSHQREFLSHCRLSFPYEAYTRKNVWSADSHFKCLHECRRRRIEVACNLCGNRSLKFRSGIGWVSEEHWI